MATEIMLLHLENGQRTLVLKRDTKRHLRLEISYTNGNRRASVILDTYDWFKLERLMVNGGVATFKNADPSEPDSISFTYTPGVVSVEVKYVDDQGAPTMVTMFSSNHIRSLTQAIKDNTVPSFVVKPTRLLLQVEYFMDELFVLWMHSFKMQRDATISVNKELENWLESLLQGKFAGVLVNGDYNIEAEKSNDPNVLQIKVRVASTDKLQLSEKIDLEVLQMLLAWIKRNVS